MQAVCIVGYKNSGKTELASQICSKLKEYGYSVSYLKFSSHGFDNPESDTGKLSSVTDKVAGMSEQGTFISWPRSRSLLDMFSFLDSDFLVIEGGKEIYHIPRIVISEAGSEYEELSSDLALGAWGEYPGFVHDISTLVELIQSRGFVLPGLDCQACNRKDCSELAREIVQGQADISDCKALNSELSIRVNGSEIPMNPFVRSLITGTLEGMLSRLKGYTSGKINIQLET